MKEIYDTKLKNNIILKEDYDKTQKLQEEKKGKEELTSEQKGELLIEFVEENKRVPKQTEEYKDFKFGAFWDNIKQGQMKEIYDTKLKHNSILKDDYDHIQQLKEEKKGKELLTPEQKGEILITFVEEYKRIPKQKEEYKDFKIGQFWDSIKQGRMKEIYDTKLKNNSILKDDYERVQKLQEEKKGKEELTPEQKGELLITFVKEYKRIPKKTEEYKNFKIGQFWSDIKQGHNKELYETKLKHNFILKENYERVQQIKEDKKM